MHGENRSRTTHPGKMETEQTREIHGTIEAREHIEKGKRRRMG